MNTPILQTEHLSLRPFCPEDAEALFSIHQVEEVMKYFPSRVPPTSEKIERFIQRASAHWNEHGYGKWGIVQMGETDVIGWAGLEFLPELNETEVGYMVARPHWGKGYATEAAAASLRYGFAQTNLDHVIALVAPENLASRRVLEKCGMLYQETIQLWNMALRRYRLDRI